MPEDLFLYHAFLGEGADSQLGWLLESMVAGRVTSVFAQLGVPDQLADGPLTAAVLAPRVNADPAALARLLAAAAVYRLVSADNAGRYALTAMGRMLCSGDPSAAGSLAAGFLAAPFWVSAGRLAETVRSGKPVNPAAPGGLYDYFREHPDEAVWFGRAMSRVTSLLVAQLADTGFRPLASGRIVDVGGSRGTLLGYLLGTQPDATGVLFDRAEALTEAPAVLGAAGVGERTEIVVGDFLAGVPEGGDLYVLSQILHNWPEEQVRRIVSNCYQASQPGGSLLVIDWVLPDGPEPSLSHIMDLIMMMSLGGRERTQAEHEALMSSVGYSLVRATPLTKGLPYRLLEFQRG